MVVMSSSEEDSNSKIFTSLKHPIRRKILRILSSEPQTFSDLQKQFKIESSHLTYHIDGLGNLLYKTEDGKYALSSLGEAAVSMMRNVEEPPTTLRFSFTHSAHARAVASALSIGSILIGITLLPIGLFASFYHVTQYFPFRPVGSGPNPGGTLAGWLIVYPYRNVAMILLVAGIIFLTLGFLQRTLSLALQRKQG
jgi:DNA-binding transcriptional ArsR family regulator